MQNSAKLEIPDLFCRLGEGPSWDPETNTLCFIDINNNAIFQYSPENGQLKSKTLSSPPGCILQTNDASRFIVATQSGIELVSFADEPGKLLLARLSLEDKALNRFNDGKVDPQGRIWVGSMACDCKGTEGFLYRLKPDLSWTVERKNVGISNGLAWTKDQKTLYYIDSTPKTVFAFDFDAATGNISNERAVFVMSGDGCPDGMTIDRDDHLWVALWGGGSLVRINPQTGQEVDRIHVPGAKNITSCCFGGPNLTTLYITSARDDCDTAEFPQGGGVFSYEFTNGVSGFGPNKFTI